MLSGNGRHRRPRQAPALLVAAGVTGSAIAIPLLGAVSASAADGTTWDKVANCETGGSWSQNDGTGFYGGLKLSQDDWEQYGGLDYASRPDLASRNQQIAVAEKILDDQGVGAFHTCGLTTGLSKDDGSADIDTGILDDSSDSSSDSSDGSGSTGLSNTPGGTSDDSSSTDSSTSPSASPDSSSDSSTNSDESDDYLSPSDSPSEPTASGSQGSDSSSTDRAKGDDSDKSEQAVGSWSLVDTGAVGSGKHRGASADENTVASDTEGSAQGSYTVHGGDTLASIADSLGLDGGWRALYAENKQAIGADPNDIAAGQTLRLPGE
ncbi:transglycosylase family protein [Streptomyces sp. NPDC002499]